EKVVPYAGGIRTNGTLALEDFLIGPADAMDRCAIYAGAGHADNVDASVRTGISVQHAVGAHIIGDARQPADKGMSTDPSELMHSRTAAENDTILDLHMAGQQHRIGQDDVIAEMAVMRNMRASQEKVVAADQRAPATADGTGI